jgi:hypothetical protein
LIVTVALPTRLSAFNRNFNTSLSTGVTDVRELRTQLLSKIGALSDRLNWIESARSGLQAEREICSQYRGQIDERIEVPEHDESMVRNER